MTLHKWQQRGGAGNKYLEMVAILLIALLGLTACTPDDVPVAVAV